MSGVRELDHVEFVPSEMSCFFLILKSNRNADDKIWINHYGIVIIRVTVSGTKDRQRLIRFSGTKIYIAQRIFIDYINSYPQKCKQDRWFFFLVLYEHDVKLNDFFCTSYINTFLTWEFITPPIDLQAPIYDINQFIWFIC